MLPEFLTVLSEELHIFPPPEMGPEGRAKVEINREVHVDVQELKPGVAMHARVCPCPEGKREDLYIKLMEANLLGQGTGGARIGLTKDEKFLTLSLGLPYEMNYQDFKQQLELFVNYLDFWRQEIEK